MDLKVMVSVTGPFDGGDPSTAETRTMTIGENDPALLPEAVGAWAHGVTARLLAGVGIETDDDIGDDEDGAVGLSDVPVGLWESLGAA